MYKWLAYNKIFLLVLFCLTMPPTSSASDKSNDASHYIVGCTIQFPEIKNFVPFQEAIILYKQAVSEGTRGNFTGASVLLNDALRSKTFRDNSITDLTIVLNNLVSGGLDKKYGILLFNSLEALRSASFVSAIKSAEEAKQINPTGSILPYIVLAKSYAALNQNQEAIVQLKEGIEIDNISIEPYFLLSSLFTSMEKFDDAKLVLEKAFKIAKNSDLNNSRDTVEKLTNKLLEASINTYYRRAIVNASLGNFTESESLLKTVLAIDELDYDSLNSLSSLIDLKRGKITKDYCQVFFKGMNYLQTNEYKLALEALHEAIKLDPDYAKAYCAIGIVYYLSGDIPTARTWFNAAIRKNRKFSLAYYNLGVTFINTHDWQSAIATFKKTIRISPKDARAYSNLGFAYASSQNTHQAVEAYKKSIETKPLFFSTPYYQLASTYRKIGNINAAIKYFKLALLIDPTDPDIYNALGLCYYQDFRPNEAAFYFEKAILAGSSNWSDYYNLAYILFDHHPDIAEQYFKKSLEIDPHSANSYMWLANTQNNLKKHADAWNNYLRAKDLFQLENNTQLIESIEKNMRHLENQIDP